MTTEKKPPRRLCRRQNCRRLCRRQNCLQVPIGVMLIKKKKVPIGVSIRQQLLQRAMNTTHRPVEVRMAALEMEMKRVKNSNEKERAELREMEAMLPQLIAERMHAEEERMHALEECVWTQAYGDAMEALFFAP